MKGEKDIDLTWDTSTRTEEWRKCNTLVVTRGICSKDGEG